MAAKSPLISVQHLTIGYRSREGELQEVVRDVSLELAPRQTLGLVGESGCGKSTLALALLGHVRAGGERKTGRVCFGGEDLFQAAPATLQALRGGRLALVPQNAGQALTPTMTIGAQLIESLRLHRDLERAVHKEAALDLLAQVRLPQPARLFGRYPHELSGGQQQRVAIAVALAGQPDVYILDEPTTGLDVTTQAHILALLEEVRERTHAAMVCVSHDLGVIARLSEDVCVMYAGEIVEARSAVALFSRPGHPYTRGLLASVPRLNSMVRHSPMPGQPPAPSAQRVGCAFAARCTFALDECTVITPPLEELPSDGGARGYSLRCHRWREVALEPWPPVREAVTPAVKVPPAALALLHVQDVTASYTHGGLSAQFARLLRRAAPAPVLSEMSLSINPGETVALVGESGSGKSTLARLVAGLKLPDAGTIAFDDVVLPSTVSKRTLGVRQAIQIVFQNPDASLNPRHTVGQILDYALRLFFSHLTTDERRARAIERLEQVRLSEHYLHRFPRQLSGGEKQRVAIARAFAAEPRLVLCDEVVSALDVSVQAAVLDLLAELQGKHGVAYLFISHDLAVVRSIADRVAVLYQGHLCEIGPVQHVFNDPSHPYTRLLLSAVLEPVPGRRSPVSDAAPGDGEPAMGGCAFQRACPRHLGRICDEETPPWRTAAPGHAIRCHLPLEELSQAQPSSVLAAVPGAPPALDERNSHDSARETHGPRPAQSGKAR